MCAHPSSCRLPAQRMSNSTSSLNMSTDLTTCYNSRGHIHGSLHFFLSSAGMAMDLKHLTGSLGICMDPFLREQLGKPEASLLWWQSLRRPNQNHMFMCVYMAHYGKGWHLAWQGVFFKSISIPVPCRNTRRPLFPETYLNHK